MRKLAFLAALAFGCDDPAVSAKVTDVLAYGAVEAHATCSASFGGPGANIVYLNATRFVDGATLVLARLQSVNHPAVAFCERGVDCPAETQLGQSTETIGVAGSDFFYDHAGSVIHHDFDISTYCTGRNLGAF